MFLIYVFSVVHVRSLCSEDHLSRSCILLGSTVDIYFSEHLQCSKKIILMSDFLSLRGVGGGVIGTFYIRLYYVPLFIALNNVPGIFQ